MITKWQLDYRDEPKPLVCTRETEKCVWYKSGAKEVRRNKDGGWHKLFDSRDAVIDWLIERERARLAYAKSEVELHTRRLAEMLVKFERAS